MYRHSLSRWILFLLLLIAAGCTSSSGEESAVEAPLPTAAPSATVDAPDSPVADEPLVEPEAPDTVVRAFYDWYVAYMGERGSDDFRNPLVDGAYRETPYLTASFVGHVDELLETMRTEYGGAGYDPFLCAQDIPTFIRPGELLMQGEKASVVVTSSFPNQVFVVDLLPAGASWQISNITCGGSPTADAAIFYTWYLGYIGDRSSGTFNNPLVDGAYRDSVLLTEEMIAHVDESVAGMTRGGFDPFLLAQDIPTGFSVDPGVEDGTAVVHLQFGPENVTHLKLQMVESGGRWCIDAITFDQGLPTAAPDAPDALAPAGDEADWQVLDLADWGAALALPPDWIAEPLPLDVPGAPDDWPVVAAWQLMPAEIRDQVVSSGPPDPAAPVVVAPFQLEIIAGDQAAIARVLSKTDGELITINEHPATRISDEPGVVYYLIPHPGRSDLWFLLTDWVTEFPGREAQAAAARDVVAPLLQSMLFAQ